MFAEKHFRSWVGIMDRYGDFIVYQSEEPGQEICEKYKQQSNNRLYMRFTGCDNAAEAEEIAKDWAAQYYRWKEKYKEGAK